MTRRSMGVWKLRAGHSGFNMVPVAECALHPAIGLRRHVERYVFINTRVSPHIVKPLSPRPETGIAFDLDCRGLRVEYTGGQVMTQPGVAVSDR